MTVTDITAILAIILSSGVLALELRRWFDSKPKLRASASAGWHDTRDHSEADRVMVILTNYGNQTILVKSLWVFGFKGLLGKTLGKREWSGFVFNSGLHPLPFKLEPASEWQGLVVQNDVLNASIAKGLAFVGIAHSHASKPLLVKIQKAIEAPEEKTP